MSKSKRMTWAGYMICMGKKKNPYSIFLGSPKIRDHFENLCVGGG
jgi:hypothetical protein